jgi:hypothetical protein
MQESVRGFGPSSVDLFARSAPRSPYIQRTASGAEIRARLSDLACAYLSFRCVRVDRGRWLPARPRPCGGLGAYLGVTPRWELYGDNVKYIAMVRDGVTTIDELPFGFRWLTPALAGSLNITPCRDMHALASLNFAALAGAAAVMAVLLSRVGRSAAYGILGAAVLATSYWANYAGENRFLTDNLGYFLLALTVFAVDERRIGVAAVSLLLFSLNSEKAAFWLVLPPLPSRSSQGRPGIGHRTSPDWSFQRCSRLSLEHS